MDARKVLLVLSIILVAWAVAGCAGKKADGRAGDGEKAPLAQADAAAYPTKSTGGVDSGNVLVEATPKGMVDGRFVIEVQMNTHSVDLGQVALAKDAVLTINGKGLLPVSAPAFNGHHGGGLLAFDVGEEPTSFGLTITGIPSVEKREYRWG